MTQVVTSENLPLIRWSTADVEASRSGQHVLSVRLDHVTPDWINALRSSFFADKGLAVEEGNVRHGASPQDTSLLFVINTSTLRYLIAPGDTEQTKRDLNALVKRYADRANERAREHERVSQQIAEERERAAEEARKLRDQFRNGES